MKRRGGAASGCGREFHPSADHLPCVVAQPHVPFQRERRIEHQQIEARPRCEQQRRELREVAHDHLPLDVKLRRDVGDARGRVNVQTEQAARVVQRRGHGRGAEQRSVPAVKIRDDFAARRQRQAQRLRDFARRLELLRALAPRGRRRAEQFIEVVEAEFLPAGFCFHKFMLPPGARGPHARERPGRCAGGGETRCPRRRNRPC